MKKVLIITYHFPPRPGVGSIRLKGLAKYLPEFDWSPIVLTAALPSTPDSRFNVIQSYLPGDVFETLKKRIGLKSTESFREKIGISGMRKGLRFPIGKMIEIVRGIIAYPGIRKGWCPFAVEAAEDIMKKEHIDVILSSSPPVTAHLIAREIKMRHGLPWVADMRDLWTQNHYYSYGSIRRYFERKLEKKTLSVADSLVTVSAPLRTKLAAFHKDKDIHVILNGFDPENVVKMPLTKKFSITYTGQLLDGKRDPVLLFTVISQLIKSNIIDPKKVIIRFYGPYERWLEHMTKKYELESVAFQYGMLTHEDAIKMQAESHILLLLNWNDPQEKGVYTGKIFEYLAAKRPIIAVGGPQGVISELLKETNAGIHIEGCDELRSSLIRYYDEYIKNGVVSYRGYENILNLFSHVEMVRNYTNILNKLTYG